MEFTEASLAPPRASQGASALPMGLSRCGLPLVPDGCQRLVGACCHAPPDTKRYEAPIATDSPDPLR